MNKIKLIRLTSGEEILVYVVNESGLTLTVTNPVLLIPNNKQIGFMPYMSYCEMESMTIKKDHIMFNLMPTEDLKGQYREMIEGTNKIQLNETPQILV
jgi:hypothetical protein|tara:strand:+ start:2681 stop:2974 length:294 start_codon:yes stop_codon:yes gene_type:complete